MTAQELAARFSASASLCEAHPTSMAFMQVLVEAAEMHARKAADYGTGSDPLANIRASEEFGVPPWVGAVLRANDKVTRIKSFIKKGKLLNESVEDSLLDNCVYFPIALVLYREMMGEEPDPLLEPLKFPKAA